MRTLGRFIGIVLGLVLLIAIGVLYERNRTELGGEPVGQKIDRSLERTGNAVTGTGDEVARSARERTDAVALAAREKADAASQAAREKADRVREVTTQAGEDMREHASAGIERGAEKLGAAKAAVQGRVDRTSDALSDAAITASINADILKDPGLSTRRVQVFTRQGEVTLQGSVESELVRQRAERMAGAVAGVTKVDNQLVVGAAPVSAGR